MSSIRSSRVGIASRAWRGRAHNSHVQTNVRKPPLHVVVVVTILGYHEEQLKVIATPDGLIVSAEPKHRHSKNHLAAIGAKRIFQRFDLPNSIDTGSVHATFENGLLKITARLAAPKLNTASTHA